MTKEKKVPAYLCQDCAEEFPKKFETLGYGYTIFTGHCPICEEERGLASAADYGLQKDEVFD